MNGAAADPACVIAGGGPAGVMLGLLLARAGVPVTVLEKHADFLRDFRGDTIHPSTLEVLNELGILEEFLKLPHHEAPELIGWIGDIRSPMADFRHLPVRCGFIAFMPQWDFLTFLCEKARAYPGFDLRMSTQAVSLIDENGRVAGVRARGPRGEYEIRAGLTIACDGRHSTLVPAAGLTPRGFGAPMDVLWFKISKRDGENREPGGRFDAGRIFILIDRGDHYQCGYVIAKDGFEAVKSKGIEAFRAEVARLAGLEDARVAADLKSFADTSLLSVAVNRLEKWWRPGFLAIGDAAHAMSPVGGVGINLAIQDAVAAANRLAAPLLAGGADDADLAAVEARRLLPARLTQWAQVQIQNRIIRPALGDAAPSKPPLFFRLLARFAFLRRLPGRLVGMGVRPEHVRTGEAAGP